MIIRYKKREILGVSVSLSEAEVHWRAFLESLIKRGLHGVRFIVSDDHKGIKAARTAIFSGVMWQRCQFHLAQNAQHYAKSQSMREIIAGLMREIFDSRDLDSARQRVKEIVVEYEKTAPEFVNWLEENIEEGLTVFSLPPSIRKRLRTSNMMETLNKQIKRRTRVAALFPNPESCLRLVSAVVQEIHEEWVCGKKYLDLSEWLSKK